MATARKADDRATRELPLVGLATQSAPIAGVDARELARELYGIDGEPRALHSERNDNYRVRGQDGRALILKLSGAGEDLGGIDLQIAALDHIARHAPDLPVPRVIRTRDGESRVDREGARVFAVSVLPGGPLVERADQRDLLRPAAVLVGRVSRALRGFHHGRVPDRLVWDLRRASLLAPAAALIEDGGLRTAIERVFARFVDDVVPRFDSFRSQFTHNDGNTPNILIDGSPPEISGLVDFGDMTYGPMVIDLAIGCADNVPTGESPLPSMLAQVAGFTGERPLEDGEVELLYECILARFAVGITVHAWRLVHDPAGVELLADWNLTTVPALDALLALGRAPVIAALGGAARRTAPLPVRGTAPDLRALIARRHKVLGRDLSLTYQQPLHIVRGDGVWLYDASGRPFLDAYNNVPQVGHCHPHVVEAVARQAATLNTNTRYLHETVVNYAERLTATMPEGLDVCIFVNSGSEANDVAWRIATTWTGERGALVMANAYHGITEAIAALSPYEVAANALAPHVRTLEAPETYRGRFGRDVADAAARYAADADRAIASLAGAGMKPALLMVDTGFTSNGIPDVPGGYFAAVVDKVRRAGGLFVADEVQFGVGRPGTHMWGFGFHGVVPDIVTMGKPIADGHPLGVVVTRRDILDKFFAATGFFSTFGGNPVSAAAGLATLEVLEREGLQDNARTTGAHFKAGLKALMARHEQIGDVRGAGLLIGVDIVKDRASKAPDKAETDRVKNRVRELGVLFGTEGAGGNLLKIRPPLPFRPEHADIAVAALDQALGER